MSMNAKADERGMQRLVELRRALTRASVIFGSLAVAVIMVLGGGVGERGQRMAGADAGIDDIMTGSIGGGDRYTVSRSVLQSPGAMPCIRFPDGSQRGGC